MILREVLYDNKPVILEENVIDLFKDKDNNNKVQFMVCKSSTGLWEHIIIYILQLDKDIEITLNITVCGLVGNFCVMNTVHHGIKLWKDIYSNNFKHVKINFIYSFYGTLELNRQEQLCDKLSNIAILDKVTIGKQLDNELDNNRVTTRETTSHVVSSSYINTTTYIPTEFEKIDFFPLSDIGFDESHIIQIYREHKKNPELSLSVEIIQNSINAFAFDLKHNKIAGTFKNSPAVVLTSLLKKGQPYSSKTPEKVLTPQEEAMQEYLLAQEKKQQKITEIKIKAREIALQGWLDSLSEEELLNFNQELRPDGIPDRIYQKSRRKKAEELAKDYFDTVLWPKQLKQILNSQVSLNETES